MAAREKGGRVVFIGNIPYGVSEEQICEIFGRVGSVVNFRLVYDKESGKPKGFGFLEYTNVDEAASAVRNLNEHEVMGRTLRVDYSNDNGGGRGGAGGQQDGGSGRAPPPAHFNLNGPQADANGTNAVPGDSSALPPLPSGVDLDPNLTAPDAISRTLSSIPPPQLLDIISQMKNLVQTEPQRATALLTSAPQLSYAVFQALLLLGVVDTSVINSLVQQTAPAPTPSQPPAQQMYQQPPPPQAMQQPPPQFPPQGQYGYPPQQGPPQMGYAPTPPVQQQAYQPPPQPQQAPQGQPNQEEALRAIMALTREQVYAMDAGARDQIIGLRAQFGNPV
ncbi:hypothetical protein MBLNU230_g8423t1 [Neophaeotheca triangularis]